MKNYVSSDNEKRQSKTVFLVEAAGFSPNAYIPAFAAEKREILERNFTEGQKETFEKFHDYWNEYMSLGEAAILEYAFKLGARLAVGILNDDKVG